MQLKTESPGCLRNKLLGASVQNQTLTVEAGWKHNQFKPCLTVNGHEMQLNCHNEPTTAVHLACNTVYKPFLVLCNQFETCPTRAELISVSGSSLSYSEILSSERMCRTACCPNSVQQQTQKVQQAVDLDNLGHTYPKWASQHPITLLKLFLCHACAAGSYMIHALRVDGVGEVPRLHRSSSDSSQQCH